MSCKVGNQTNSQDPQAVNSRVFVGNLNTFQCTKVDVERIFQRYGRIAGISMHKGYAFIQFTNPFDARSACLGEDGRLLWGQTLDVNLVAEPKSHQTGRKRQNMAKTGNDWDYYYDSYYAQVGFPPGPPRLVPPMKRPRIHVPPPQQLPQKQQPCAVTMNKLLLASANKAYQNQSQLLQNQNLSSTCTNNIGDLKSYSTPDILICGNCRELFSEIEQLLEHKKTYCKLRFTCKCHQINGKTSGGEEPAALLCSQCKDSFHSAWDLMVHVQTAHMLNIYQLGMESREQSEPRDVGMDSTSSTSSCSSSINGTISPTSSTMASSSTTASLSLLSANGFSAPGLNNNPNLGLGMMMGLGGGCGDSLSLMEDSHSQTDDLDLSPNPPSSNSGEVVTVTNSISTSTNTNDLLQASMLVNGDAPPNANHQGYFLNGNNNGCFSSTSPINSEASTQTSHSDNLLLLNNNNNNNNNNTSCSNGPSVSVSNGGNGSACGTDPISGGFEEHCGLVTSIKAEGPIPTAVVGHHLLPLTNGQVASV